MPAAVRQRHTTVAGSTCRFAYGFDKKPQVGLWVVQPQRFWPIPVHDTIGFDVAHLIAAIAAVSLIAAAHPKVMRARCVSGGNRRVERRRRAHPAALRFEWDRAANVRCALEAPAFADRL